MALHSPSSGCLSVDDMALANDVLDGLNRREEKKSTDGDVVGARVTTNELAERNCDDRMDTAGIARLRRIVSMHTQLAAATGGLSICTAGCRALESEVMGQGEKGEERRGKR